MNLTAIGGLLSVFLAVEAQGADQGVLTMQTSDGVAPLTGEKENHFLDWAKVHVVPLQSVEPTGNSADLQPLKDIVGTARVVALGEPAHGAHEPLAFRNRLFCYLVEELGFTAIAVESALPESRRVFDFVAGGAGDARRIVRMNFSWGFGNFSENVELVQWIRDHNLNASHRRKVRFYGIDVALRGPNWTIPAPTALADALAYLDRVDTESAARMRTILQPALDRLAAAKAVPGFPSESDMAALDDLIAQLERERPAYPSRAPAADYEWALRSAVVARQEYRSARLRSALADKKGISPTEWQSMNARDSAMAENVLWTLQQEGREGRILVFAHNCHVKNAATEGGLWSPLERPAFAMGQYLRAALGNELVIIGVSSAANAKGLPPASRERDSFDATLAQVGLPRFLLNLRAPQSDLAVVDWLNERRPWRANFSTYSIVSPRTAFDACVFIDVLTPTQD